MNTAKDTAQHRELAMHIIYLKEILTLCDKTFFFTVNSL